MYKLYQQPYRDQWTYLCIRGTNTANFIDEDGSLFLLKKSVEIYRYLYFFNYLRNDQIWILTGQWNILDNSSTILLWFGTGPLYPGIGWKPKDRTTRPYFTNQVTRRQIIFIWMCRKER